MIPPPELRDLDPWDECGSCGHDLAEHTEPGGPCLCDVLHVPRLGPSDWRRCTCPAFAA